MHFSELKTTLRKNLGNYEHVESTLTLVLAEDDSIVEAMEKMEENLRMSVGNTPIVKFENIPVDSKPVATKEEAVTKKKPAKKKKAPATKKAKEPVVVPTLEEMMVLCRDTANKLKSGEKVKALIQDTCGVGSLKEVTDTACFIDLKKKLEDA